MITRIGLTAEDIIYLVEVQGDTAAQCINQHQFTNGSQSGFGCDIHTPHQTRWAGLSGQQYRVINPERGSCSD